MAKDADASSWWADFWRVLKCELALFKKVPPLAGAAFILMMIPSFYTGTYVMSVWDPYGSIENMPVGLATMDEGEQFKGTGYNLGADLVQKLTEEKRFKFVVFDDAAAAEAAVRSGEVYFSLTVPADFSAKALGAEETARLVVYTSSGRSYVAMQMAKGMAQKVVDGLQTSIAVERWKAVLAAVEEAHDAAEKLRDGSAKALKGAGRLKEGLGEAKRGAQGLTEGQGRLARGLSGIDTKRLVSAGEQLHGSTAKLAEGLAKSEVLGAITGVGSADLKKLAKGAREYQEKVEELAAGLEKAAAGANELAKKDAELWAGLERLHGGSDVLTEGMGKIHEGLDEFTAALVVGEEKPESLAVPVAFARVDVVGAPGNGPAFAPYFMGLSLWVGVLGVGFLFRSITFPQSVAGASRIAKITGKWAAPFLISSAAACILGLSIHFVLDVPVADEVGYYVILVTAVLTFNSIILSLTSLTGDAGKLAALVLLVVQISSVGGAYPLATQPYAYRAISPYLPMTSVVFGLRAAMFGSFGGDWLRYVLNLLPWFFISHWVGLIAARRFNYVDDDHYGPAVDLSFMKREKSGK